MNTLAASNLLGYDAVYICVLSLHSMDFSNPEYCGASYSKTSIPIFKSTWCRNPEKLKPSSCPLREPRTLRVRVCITVMAKASGKFIIH